MSSLAVTWEVFGIMEYAANALADEDKMGSENNEFDMICVDDACGIASISHVDAPLCCELRVSMVFGK